jgi:hypothetical protein
MLEVLNTELCEQCEVSKLEVSRPNFITQGVSPRRDVVYPLGDKLGEDGQYRASLLSCLSASPFGSADPFLYLSDRVPVRVERIYTFPRLCAIKDWIRLGQVLQNRDSHC